MNGTSKRCAIYTRKSSEEGLDQDFNSLDAQREACAAYVLSQAQEGWEALSGQYDDGGFSGGTMERPALKALLTDIEADRVDVVVVYKVDRLTRSLADFAKIVEILDNNDASFVSVTQAFNTTTSMGRLTLNVLLSFAQFEREVTGERIRDKIAASKRKGMWMGGLTPLGYESRNRKLEIVEQEAETVRRIFKRYLELGSVDHLQRSLESEGIVSKVRINRHGRMSGGTPLARGALYHLLQNRVYLGEITHKGNSYPGDHQAIIDPALFKAVQERLEANRRRCHSGSGSKEPSLLSGILTHQGKAMTPAHAVKNNKRYRYYVEVKCCGHQAARLRLPASDIETLVLNRIRQLLDSSKELHKALGVLNPTAESWADIVTQGSSLARKMERLSISSLREVLNQLEAAIHIKEETIEISLDQIKLMNMLVPESLVQSAVVSERFSIRVKAQLTRTGHGTKLTFSEGNKAPNLALVRLIVKAHLLRDKLLSTSAKTLEAAADEIGVARSYFIRILRLTFLAPDITQAILEGTQPPDLSARKLMADTRYPLCWAEQRTELGFAPPTSN